MYFPVGEKELDYLSKKDRKLGRAIDAIGRIEREVTPDLFTALISSIVAQQIAAKAYKTVWQRIIDALGSVTPDTVEAVPLDQLQQCGISFRKASYIKRAAAAVRAGELDLAALPGLSDADVAAALSELPGIGCWTAEMLMIFSMQRPNILSYGDYAIHRGLRMLYRHKQITKPLFAKYARRYAPYASVASLYLWAISSGAVEGLTDPGEA